MDEVSSHVRLDLPSSDGKAAHLDCSASFSDSMMKGLVPIPEEKREPVGDIDTEVVDGLKVLDPKWPIREADTRHLTAMLQTCRPLAFTILRTRDQWGTA